MKTWTLSGSLRTGAGTEESSFHIFVEVPSTTPLGQYSSRIVLYSQRPAESPPGETPIEEIWLPCSRVFRVALTVVEPSDDVVPATLATASIDRIAADEQGHLLVRDQLVVVLPFDIESPDELIGNIATSTAGVVVGSSPELMIYQLRFDVPEERPNPGAKSRDPGRLSRVEPGAERFACPHED